MGDPFFSAHLSYDLHSEAAGRQAAPEHSFGLCGQRQSLPLTLRRRSSGKDCRWPHRLETCATNRLGDFDMAFGRHSQVPVKAAFLRSASVAHPRPAAFRAAGPSDRFPVFARQRCFHLTKIHALRFLSPCPVHPSPRPANPACLEGARPASVRDDFGLGVATRIL